ncbi:hypothetical protein WN51_06996 [Melipona quadrifasciata]|uniref:Uncharacterized protein n=1 Tax=Melipona quadrifasciata TaxID=166423 RepID=A0A0N0U340_9HYME|nr:hypothetical protein WN51_06996 [Melipona quadrifasciata]
MVVYSARKEWIEKQQTLTELPTTIATLTTQSNNSDEQKSPSTIYPVATVTKFPGQCANAMTVLVGRGMEICTHIESCGQVPLRPASELLNWQFPGDTRDTLHQSVNGLIKPPNQGTGTKPSRFANRFGGDPIVKSIRPLRGILTGRPRFVRDRNRNATSSIG